MFEAGLRQLCRRTLGDKYRHTGCSRAGFALRVARGCGSLFTYAETLCFIGDGDVWQSGYVVVTKPPIFVSSTFHLGEPIETG